MALPAVIEIQGLRSVEESESLSLIVDRVRMYDIHDHRDAEAMGIIDQGLELLRSTETRTQGKEVCDLIAERSIIRMLLKGHDLKGVISQLGHLRKHILAEFLECTDLLLLRSHADMAFIDKRMRPLSRLSVLPLVGLERIPHLSAECLGVRILYSPGHIGRKPLGSAALPLYVKLVKRAVVKEHGRKHYLPVSASQRLEGISLGTFPVVELSDEIYLRRIRSPLTENPVSLSVTMKSVIHVVVHALGKRASHRESVLELKDHLMPAVNHLLVRLQPFIMIIDHLFLLLCAHIFSFSVLII